MRKTVIRQSHSRSASDRAKVNKNTHTSSSVQRPTLPAAAAAAAAAAATAALPAALTAAALPSGTAPADGVAAVSSGAAATDLDAEAEGADEAEDASGAGVCAIRGMIIAATAAAAAEAATSAAIWSATEESTLVPALEAVASAGLDLSARRAWLGVAISDLVARTRCKPNQKEQFKRKISTMKEFDRTWRRKCQRNNGWPAGVCACRLRNRTDGLER